MNILLAVTGSVAAYKAQDLCRQLVNSGHQVQVILTTGALEFVKKEIFSYLGAQTVYGPNDDFIPRPYQQHPETQGSNVLHVELSKWAHCLLLAPLSANTMARLSRGEASDLLTSVFLAFRQRPIFLFPAMNTHMWEHPFTQENWLRLQQLPHVVAYPPVSGPLACGDYGLGKFPAVEHILAFILHYAPPTDIKKPSILISAGATVSPLDPVRYLTNPSSGLTGLKLAQKFLVHGHRVHVVAGVEAAALFAPLQALPHFQLTVATTTASMRNKILPLFQECDVYFSTAAMCDIQFPIAEGKIKKNKFADSLPVRPAPDVLAEVLQLRLQQHRQHRQHQQKVVGFAAETDLTAEILYEKWQRKPVDLLVGNIVHSGYMEELSVAQGFRAQEGLYYFVKEGKIVENETLTKDDLAQHLYEWTKQWSWS